jgi:hypothetical protein
MKIYVVTTGVLFTLITAAHVWRMVVERPLATDPWYVLITPAAAILSVWAWRLVTRSSNT